MNNQKNTNSTNRFHRNTTNKVLGGVCSGLANYFGISVLLVRMLWIIFSILFCIGCIVYIILWSAIPDEKQIANTSAKGVIKKSSSILGFIILGSVLGLWGGWVLGQSLGHTGSASIITLAIALFCCPIGGVLGAIIGPIIVSKTK